MGVEVMDGAGAAARGRRSAVEAVEVRRRGKAVGHLRAPWWVAVVKRGHRKKVNLVEKKKRICSTVRYCGMRFCARVQFSLMHGGPTCGGLMGETSIGVAYLILASTCQRKDALFHHVIEIK